MNIFWLDQNTTKAAQYHCDKHVANQIKEYAQILSTAAKLGGFYRDWMYQPIPTMNPGIHEWAAESKQNYLSLLELGEKLYGEFRWRYDSNHKSYWAVIDKIDPDMVTLEWGEQTDPPQAMADQYKVEGDFVAAYRNYYIYGEPRAKTWKRRGPPSWFPAPDPEERMWNSPSD